MGGAVPLLKKRNNETSLFPFLLQAMASTEEKAYEIMRELDVSYVLVIFGGLTGYSSDGEKSFTAMHMWIGKVVGGGGGTLQSSIPYLVPVTQRQKTDILMFLPSWNHGVHMFAQTLSEKFLLNRSTFCNQTWYGGASS